MDFKLTSKYKPTGDQPEAIRQLVEGVNDGVKYQTLLGVTGSGKTFTIANVIEKVQRPTLILSHNKTLAAQLYGEFKGFFPENAVEYFVSYYDYYQPEAYLPNSDTYIEKDLAINDEIEKLRLATTTALLSGRRRCGRHDDQGGLQDDRLADDILVLVDSRSRPVPRRVRPQGVPALALQERQPGRRP